MLTRPHDSVIALIIKCGNHNTTKALEAQLVFCKGLQATLDPAIFEDIDEIDPDTTFRTLEVSVSMDLKLLRECRWDLIRDCIDIFENRIIDMVGNHTCYSDFIIVPSKEEHRFGVMKLIAYLRV